MDFTSVERNGGFVLPLRRKCVYIGLKSYPNDRKSMTTSARTPRTPIYSFFLKYGYSYGLDA